MMRLASFVSAVAVVSLVACGPSKRSNSDDDDDTDAAQPDTYCPTSISGKVFAPNGTLALYNVTVYAPVSDPPPFTEGVQCGQCSTTLPGGAYASVSTDPEGKFKLEGIPVGANVPIIITSGKWRRKFVIPQVTACTDTAIPDGQFRLPRDRTEGEMPRIAMVAGGCDNLANVFKNLGIATAEFGTNSAGPERMVQYNGNGGAVAGAQSATSLWGSLDEMKKFDLVVNSCECNEYNDTKTSPDLLRQYADIGGRVFGSHFHYTWTKNLIPQWSGTATWTAGNGTGPDIIDQTHPSGMALARYLLANGASTTLGQITLSGQKTPNASAVAPGTTRWIQASGVVGQAPTTHYLSFNTPVGLMPENQCGKVVYAGMHVTPGTGSTFTTDEKAFAFLLFDLTTCINPLE